MANQILEIGGGGNPKYHPNMDVRKGPQVDITADLSKPFPLNDASFSHVYSAFMIEHLSWRSMPLFLSEVYRILEPNGTCFFITANLLEQCRKIVETPDLTEDMVCMLFGGQDYPENTHRCGFSPDYVFKVFRAAGFSGISVRPLPTCNTDMIVEARK